MFISCHTILTTQYQGPSKGTLIIGRYFDKALLRDFEDIMRSSLLMYRADVDMPPDFQAKLKNFSETPGKPIIEPLNEEKIAGYFVFNNISGNPALVIRADFPRDLYRSSEKTLNQSYLFGMISVLLSILFIFIINRTYVRTKKIEKRTQELRSEFIDLVDKSAKKESEEGFYDVKYLIKKNNEELYSLSQKIDELGKENKEIIRQFPREKNRNEENNDSYQYKIAESERIPSEEINNTLAVERIALYRQLYSEFSHSIKTPLSTIGVFVNKTVFKKIENLNECDKAERQEIILDLKNRFENAQYSLDTIKGIINECGGASSTNSQHLSLASLIATAIRISKDITKTKCKVSVSVDEVPDFESNWFNVFIPIMEVIKNAFEAVNDNGCVSINGTFHDGIIEIFISDNGIPITEKIKGNIFDSGFSSKGQNRGIGLKIVVKCLESIGGSIRVVSSTIEETTFCISFKPQKVYR
jgi:signal transduction histidine kinase